MTTPVWCTCYSLYEDDDGKTIHYQECDIIQRLLGYL